MDIFQLKSLNLDILENASTYNSFQVSACFKFIISYKSKISKRTAAKSA